MNPTASSPQAAAARRRGLVWTAAAYLLALAAALAVNHAVALAPVWQAALGTAVATVVVFGFSFWLDNTSLYDPYWSVAPVAIAASWLATAESPGPRAWLLMGIVSLWGVRLTANWVRRWRGLGDEDWRYAGFRSGGRVAYWAVSFAGLHFFPSVLTFLGTLPVYAAVANPARPLGALDVIGALVALAGTLLEAVADGQLHRFLATDRSARAPFLATGLWAHSRHPNYLGELMLWWGLCLSGLAALPGAPWVASGAVAITALFTTYSARAMDRRMLRHEGFAAHMAAVPALIPGASTAARVAKGALGLAGLAALTLSVW